MVRPNVPKKRARGSNASKMNTQKKKAVVKLLDGESKFESRKEKGERTLHSQKEMRKSTTHAVSTPFHTIQESLLNWDTSSIIQGAEQQRNAENVINENDIQQAVKSQKKKNRKITVTSNLSIVKQDPNMLKTKKQKTVKNHLDIRDVDSTREHDLTAAKPKSKRLTTSEKENDGKIVEKLKNDIQQAVKVPKKNKMNVLSDITVRKQDPNQLTSKKRETVKNHLDVCDVDSTTKHDLTDAKTNTLPKSRRLAISRRVKGGKVVKLKNRTTKKNRLRLLPYSQNDFDVQVYVNTSVNIADNSWEVETLPADDDSANRANVPEGLDHLQTKKIKKIWEEKAANNNRSPLIIDKTPSPKNKYSSPTALAIVNSDEGSVDSFAKTFKTTKNKKKVETKVKKGASLRSFTKTPTKDKISRSITKKDVEDYLEMFIPKTNTSQVVGTSRYGRPFRSRSKSCSYILNTNDISKFKAESKKKEAARKKKEAARKKKEAASKKEDVSKIKEEIMKKEESLKIRMLAVEAEAEATAAPPKKKRGRPRKHLPNNPACRVTL